MPRFGLTRRAPSFSVMSNRLPVPSDPLDFLASAGVGVGSRDVYGQIHGAFHAALADVERTIITIFDPLENEGHVSDRMVLEANSDLRNELARASAVADQKRSEMRQEITLRLQRMYIQQLVSAPDQEAPARRWVDLADRTIRRDLPFVSEPGQADMDVALPERRRRLARWRAEADEWLETLCLNHVGEVLAGMRSEMNEYGASWTETLHEIRRHVSSGGRMYEEVTDAECWTFDSDDPTVKNLLSGRQAQSIAGRILSRFQLSNQDLAEISEFVQDALDSRPVYGTDRVDTEDLEDLIAVGVAQKIRSTVSIDSGFLSLISTGPRFGEDLGELLVDMHMGAAAMEERMWRVGEVRVGHVDSASGVGITSSSLHDSVLRGLGGGRKFAAVEGHPGDNHRFEVQMSTVGAPVSDLALFREMVGAWYAWHFEDARGANGDKSEWMETLKLESWRLYPDIGQDTGVRNAIVELIDEDLKEIWNARDDIASRLVNGQLDDTDRDVIRRFVNGSRRSTSVDGE